MATATATRTSTQTATWRKTKDGEWVVFGPLNVVKAGEVVQVRKRSGEIQEVLIERVGKGFDTADGRMRYGYTTRRGTGYGYAGRTRKACITDGNCSSFGSGRSCGGHDCDGY